MTTYSQFLESKAQVANASGFEPIWLPDFLFDFQRELTRWAILKGRAAIFADCGLGKTPMQLVWAENVVRKTNKPVLILTPISVGHQTVKEAAKFGIGIAHSKAGELPSRPGIVVTNYERLHYFNPESFAGVVCDESLILKNFKGSRKAAVTEFMRTRPYRLLCTATASPNDYDELGTSSEALGEMGYQDMLTRYFRKRLANRGTVGWGLVHAYTIRAHAERDFWRWVCSWSRACRKPSDLGFDDGPFQLPPLETCLHEVKPNRLRSGKLFDLPAVTLQEQREEQRRTLNERCEAVAALVAHDKPAISWCQLNDEGDHLERIIPDCVQVSGADSDEAKEAKLSDFASGNVRVLVTKTKVAGFGLNFQHCAHQTYFPSHSFEQWYQGVRRSWRFGQTRPVVIDVVTTEGGGSVIANLERKQQQADKMFATMITLMNDSRRIVSAPYGKEEVKIPQWARSES